MPNANMNRLIDIVRASARPLTGAREDYDPLLDLIGDRRFVLLGEASHGTAEFYRERIEITKRLITERGFTAVALEADFPDARRVDAYVRGMSKDSDADAALSGFSRFPAWMWRNTIVRDFVEWLRAHNDALPASAPKIGIYCLDLYSLHRSAEAVLAYLERVDPEAAARARHRYSCFEHFGEDTQAYGYAANFGLSEPCERGALEQLAELQSRRPDYITRDDAIDDIIAADEFFAAEINAQVVADAEEYYRMMFRGRVESWNVRDRHMADTLDRIATHLTKQQRSAKIVVWAHNSHLGDARATEMGKGGEWNLGQLARERYGRDAVLIGFTTYTGTVMAASDWGGVAKRKRVRPGLENSYEGLFHEVGMKSFLLDLTADTGATELLRRPRLERAIGVIYRPETERISHYFETQLAEQFDACIHIDETSALEPLELPRDARHETEVEAPETYPSGM